MRELALFPTKRFQPKRYHPGNLGTWSGHLPFAHDLVAALRPSVLVELGTHHGESYFGFCQAVQENAVGCKCYAVDTWRGDEHAGFYEEDVFREVNAYNEANYGSFSVLIRETFDDASSHFGPHSIDLLHIDGLHTYDAVKHDVETWLPKVRPGGIVLLHDINARHANFRVWQLWDELKAAYPHFEFTHFWGLGVLRIGHSGAEESGLLRYLFTCAEEDCQAIREQYQRAAENLELSYQAGARGRGARGVPLAQVFAGGPGGFVEPSSVTREIEPGVWQRLAFLLEQGCEVPELRIDPADCPGVVELASLTIRSAANEALVLLQISEPAELQALECSYDLVPIGDGSTAKFLSYGYDPRFYLGLKQIGCTEQPLVVELWMRVTLTLGDVAALLQTPVIAPPGTAPDVQRDLELGRLTAAVTDAEAEIASLKASLAREENERSHLDIERGLAVRRVETLTSELLLHQTEQLVVTAEFRRLAGLRQILEAENVEVRERLRREQNLRISLESDNAELRKQVEQLQWSVAGHLAELSDLREIALEVEQLRGRLNIAEATVQSLREEIRREQALKNELETSYSWRMTRPVRGALKVLGVRGANSGPPQ